MPLPLGRTIPVGLALLRGRAIPCPPLQYEKKYQNKILEQLQQLNILIS